MKKGMLIVLAGVALCVAGCVSTVTQENPGYAGAYRDRVEKRFDRPAGQVFEAAKRALNSYGTITRESMSVANTNQLGFIEGSLNQYRVWMRVEGVSASATKLVVQMRASMGGTDLRMAQELQDRTAFELSAKK
jgi:hypothetical protein